MPGNQIDCPSRVAKGSAPAVFATTCDGPPANGTLTSFPPELQKIHFPSAEKLGRTKLVLSVVTCRVLPPSALTTLMSYLPSWAESNAIQRLSGDHRGLPMRSVPEEVSWIASEPSVRVRQISR